MFLFKVDLITVDRYGIKTLHASQTARFLTIIKSLRWTGRGHQTHKLIFFALILGLLVHLSTPSVDTCVDPIICIHSSASAFHAPPTSLSFTVDTLFFLKCPMLEPKVPSVRLVPSTNPVCPICIICLPTFSQFERSASDVNNLPLFYAFMPSSTFSVLQHSTFTRSHEPSWLILCNYLYKIYKVTSHEIDTLTRLFLLNIHCPIFTSYPFR